MINGPYSKIFILEILKQNNIRFEDNLKIQEDLNFNIEYLKNVDSVVLIVNPKDYFTKVMPATTVQAADGSYKNNVFPFPTTAIQSSGVDEGSAIIGLPKKYFMGIGAGSNGGKIEYSVISLSTVFLLKYNFPLPIPIKLKYSLLTKLFPFISQTVASEN